MNRGLMLGFTAFCRPFGNELESTMKQLSLVLAMTLALAACGPATENKAAPAAASDQPAAAVAPRAAETTNPIDSVLAGSWRSDANKARDAYRHPAATLEFFGVKPDQTVVEINPGGGWYTEVLAPLLMKGGHYVAAIPSGANSEYNARNNEKFRAKLTGQVENYRVDSIVEFDPKAPNFGPDGSADVVLTFRNVHNWVGGDGAEPMFKGFYSVLKPGGTLGVVDHRAADGADPAALAKSGYLTTESVIKLAKDAGFELAGQSEINANPKDTKDYEKGVWTLPPTLTLGDTDREKYVAIGESDRMTLKFIKPKGDKIFEQGTDGAGKPTDKK